MQIYDELAPFPLLRKEARIHYITRRLDLNPLNSRTFGRNCQLHCLVTSLAHAPFYHTVDPFHGHINALHNLLKDQFVNTRIEQKQCRQGHHDLLYPFTCLAWSRIDGCSLHGHRPLDASHSQEKLPYISASFWLSLRARMGRDGLMTHLSWVMLL